MRKIFLIFMFSLVMTCKVTGAEEISDFDFNNLEDVVEEKADISFNDLLKDLLEGKGVFEILKEKSIDLLKNQFFFNNKYIKSIIIISIISAIINIAAYDIKDKSIGELVALIGQIMIIGVATASFKNSISLLASTIQDITDIINSAIPFMIMLLSSTGNAAAIGGGGIIALATSITGSAIKSLIIPLLVIATLLKVLNILSKKQLLDKLSELFTKVVTLGLKISAYGFVFILTIEKISGGAINKGVGGSLKAIVKMVPVIGDVVGGVSDVAINTIATISNGVGVLLVFVIIIVSLVPIAEIAVVAFMYKAIAAVLEPICDKQTIEIIDAIGESNFIVLSALFIISLMFIMACAIILCGV